MEQKFTQGTSTKASVSTSNRIKRLIGFTGLLLFAAILATTTTQPKKPIQNRQRVASMKLEAFSNLSEGSYTLVWNSLGKDFDILPYQVFDLSGKVVQSGTVDWSKGNHKINLASLVDGPYLVQLGEGNPKISTRIVKE